MHFQTADQLLARADAAKALAEEAAKKGRNTLQEANDILNNLKGMRGVSNNNSILYTSSTGAVSFLLPPSLPSIFF
jgi:hypothetical protein